MTKLRRDDKVRLFMVGANQFEGRNTKDDVVLDSNDNYFIYMKNVNFRSGNVIEGRYLGTLDDNASIIDNHCKNVITDGKTFTVDNQKVRTARMVAVNNRTRVIVIIQN